MRPLALLAACAALAACDLPTAPEASNPYDPAFGGPRTATAPTGLRVAASSLGEITLAWADNSSFESGVRVERAAVYDDGRLSDFATVAVLPPDATAYTDRDLDSDAPVAYRVAALVADGRDSLPSDTLALRYQADRVPVDPLAYAYGEAELSPDGATLYTRSYQSVDAVDAATGAFLGRFPDTRQTAGFLADGRAALVRDASGAVLLDLVRRATREATVVLPVPASCSTARRLVVSADGTRAAASCSSRQLVVWRLAAPNAPTVIPLGPGSASFNQDIAGLSPDGRTVVGGTDLETAAFDTDTRAARWRVPVDANGAQLSPDGRHLVLTGGVERIAVRDAATGAVLAGAAGSFFGARFSADGSAVAYSAPDSNGYGSLVQVARTADLAPVARLSQADLFATTLTPGGAVAVVTSQEPPAIVRWDFSRGWEAFTLAPPS